MQEGVTWLRVAKVSVVSMWAKNPLPPCRERDGPTESLAAGSIAAWRAEISTDGRVKGCWQSIKRPGVGKGEVGIGTRSIVMTGNSQCVSGGTN